MARAFLARVALAATMMVSASGIADAQYFKPNNVGQLFQSAPAPAAKTAPQSQPASQPVIQQFKAATTPGPISSGALPAPGTSGIAGSTPALRALTPQQGAIVAPQQAPAASQAKPLFTPQAAPSNGTIAPTNHSTPSTYQPTTITQPSVVPALPSTAFQNTGTARSTAPTIVGVVPPQVPGRPNFAASATQTAPVAQQFKAAGSQAPLPSTVFPTTGSSGVAASTPNVVSTNRPNFASPSQQTALPGSNIAAGPGSMERALNVGSLVPGPIGTVSGLGAATFAVSRGADGAAIVDVAGAAANEFGGRLIVRGVTLLNDRPVIMTVADATVLRDAINQADPTAKAEVHHLLPQQFKTEFTTAGIDIEQNTTVATQAAHRMSDSFHTLRYPDGLTYNKQWQTFFSENPSPTQTQIFNKLGELLNNHPQF